jgi:hypothetical protein
VAPDVIVPDRDEPAFGRDDVASDEDKQKALEVIIDWFLHADHESICRYVSTLRRQNPGISDDELARKIVRRKALKNGLIGAVTGVPGVLLLPVTVPADLIATWKIQVYLTLCTAHVYGHDSSTTDLKTDIFLVLAGDSAKEALKRFGIEVGKAVSKKAVDKYVTREVMVQIWKVVGRKIITKAGEKSLTSFSKLVPIVGAPIGFAFDWTATKVVGANAIKYYSGGG